jgi:hypothetical protein
VIASLLLMTGLNRVWPREKRQTHNDLIGWQLSILGTTYAVILGFMLYTVWTSLVEADRNVELEANAVVDIYRLADGMPEPQRTQLQTLSRFLCECGHHSGVAGDGQRRSAVTNLSHQPGDVEDGDSG